MSSATLTDTPRRGRRAQVPATPPVPEPVAQTEAAGLRPWHFFLLTTLGLVTITVVVMRGQDPAEIVLGALTVAGAGYAGYMMYRTLRPFAGDGHTEDTTMLGGRTRAALERDKFLVLRAIKELEFDHAMGKVADGDFAEMRDRLRGRAIRLLRQLDGAAAYRAQIERDLAARLPDEAAAPAPAATDARLCAACGTANEADARFCKMCGKAVA